MAKKQDVRVLADALTQAGVKPPKKALKEFGYPNLALCVVDAVFARRYAPGSAADAVRGVQVYSAANAWTPPVTARRFALSDLVARVGRLGDTRLAGEVFTDARFSTSIKDLPLARVAVELCRNLAAQGIETKADLRDAEKSAGFAAAVAATRGFGPAGAAYLQSLAAVSAGGEDAVWLVAFVSETLGRDVDLDETRELLTAAVKRLRKKQPTLKAVDVEQVIWCCAAGFTKKPESA